jgi:hypothetical protein
MEKLTKEEENEVRQKLSEMESITEGWEKNLFATAMMEAKRWGEKIDKENKEYRKKNRLIDKY